jgi:hypothetical protein
MKIESIKCESCNDLFPVNSKKFFTISGNIYIGLEGGLIGNVLDEDKRVAKETHYCVTCFKRIIEDSTKDSSVSNIR